MPTISTLTVDVEARTSKFSTGMKTAVAGLGALAAAGAYAFGQFEESEKVARQTDAVLKSTGGVANVTAEQVEGLATALSTKSGIDDEAIQSGENLLLTFKNVQNQVGAGNDIFNQAAAASVDLAAGMAAASGGSVNMKTATLQLGKALNDPIAGMTALGRAGVQFSEQQKKQIERMVESGNVLGAQKIILAEVQSQFSGSAAANKTAAASMSVALDNLAESAGSVLAPAINSVLGAATTLFNFLGRYPGVLVAVAAAVGVLTAAWLAQKVISGIAMTQEVVHTAITVAQTAAHLAAATALGVVTAAQWLWNAALTANPIGLVIVAIAALVAGIVLLIRHFHLTDDIMRVLKATVGVVWGFIKAYVGTVIKIVVGYVKLWIAVIGFVIRVVGQLAGVVGRAFSAVYNAVRSWLSRAASFITNTWNGIIRFFGRLGGLLARAGHGMWDWLVGAVRSAANGAIGILNSLINAINSIQFHIHVAGVNVDFNGLGIPNIPTLAQGGMVLKTGLAVVHEGERFSGVGKGWGSTVNVYVQGSVIAEHDLAETVQKVLLRQKKRTGALGLG